MREIKFRAWDEVDKKFVFDGFSIVGETTLFGLLHQYPYELNRIINWEIQQFTGLKDKNGKDIYEGDIVSANGSESVLVYDFSEARKFVSPSITDHRKSEPRRSDYKVYWQDNFCQFSFMSLSDPKHSINSDVSKRDLEVIGNIYENTELIK